MLSSQTHFVAASSKKISKYSDKFIDRYASRFEIALDKDSSRREARLTILQMFLDGSIYDNLPPFYQEYTGGTGAYVKLCNRRPSVLYHLCKIIVNESVGMLFGEGHFPQVKCNEAHSETEKFLTHINNVSKIRQTMLNAAYVGSVGSVCVVIKVLNGKFYFDVLNTKHLTPIFDQFEPEKLIKLHDIKKSDGATLIAQGYEISEENKNKLFYVEREWTLDREIYYKPYLCDKRDSIDKEEDSNRSSDHNLGFVPAVWIQNLPKSHHIDGDCTFEAAIDISIEIDYHLSQIGRGLYYNSDPLLVIKDPSTINGQQFIKNQNALQLDEKGEAYYVEINGNSVSAVLDYIKVLREYGLEAVRGNRSSPDKLHAAQSGRALEMMNHPLITLVDEMRLTYGENGLLSIYRICLDIYHSGEFEINDGGFSPESDTCGDHLSLFWQAWYPSTGRDKLEEAQSVAIYRQNGLLSQETAIDYISEEYGIEDSEQELQYLDKEKIKYHNESDKNESGSVERETEKSSGS